MLVKVSVRKIGDDYGFAIDSVDGMCKDFTKENFITVGYPQNTEDYSKPVICLTKQEEITSYEDSWTNDILVPIRFCPYCGQPIEIEYTTTDCTDEYYKLEEAEHELTEEMRNTDSISERSELDNERRMIMDKMNQLLECDGSFITYGKS